MGPGFPADAGAETLPNRAPEAAAGRPAVMARPACRITGSAFSMAPPSAYWMGFRTRQRGRHGGRAGHGPTRRTGRSPGPPLPAAAAMSPSAAAAAATVERIRAGVFRCASVERDAVRRDPVPPFTAATL